MLWVPARPVNHSAADELQQIAIEAVLVGQIEGVCRILVDFELTTGNGRAVVGRTGWARCDQRPVNDQRGHGKGLHVRSKIVLQKAR